MKPREMWVERRVEMYIALGVQIAVNNHWNGLLGLFCATNQFMTYNKICLCYIEAF